MKKLIQLLIISLLCFTGFAHADSKHYAKKFTAEWVQTINKRISYEDISAIVEAAFTHGNRHNIDPFLILSIIKHESTFYKTARNKSSATGLMGIIPYWHKKKIAGRNLKSIDVNVDVGTKILKECIVKNKGNINSALKCYRGANDKKYFAQIKNSRTLMKRWVIENQFKLDLPIYYASSDNNVTF